MKVIISQGVTISGDPYPHNWKKEYESIVIPRVGDYIEDPLWKDPGEYKVISVTFNYFFDECYVRVEDYSVDIPKGRKDEFTHIAGLHGWKTSWNLFK